MLNHLDLKSGDAAILDFGQRRAILAVYQITWQVEKQIDNFIAGEFAQNFAQLWPNARQGGGISEQYIKQRRAHRSLTAINRH